MRRCVVPLFDERGGLNSGVNDRVGENPELYGNEGTARPPDRIKAIARSTACIDGAQELEIEDGADVVIADVVTGTVIG